MSARRLLIVGAGGFGREIATWAYDVPASRRDWDVVAGFLDRDPAASADRRRLPVLGSEDDFEFGPEDRVVIAIGDGALRRQVAERLAGRARFTRIIHPTALIGGGVRLGEGVVFAPYAVATTDVDVGNHVIVNVAATIGHDARLGDFVTLSAHVDVTGGAIIEEGAFLGTHAVVLPEARVGAFARVGANTTVLRRVEPRVTVFGSPARRV